MPRPVRKGAGATTLRYYYLIRRSESPTSRNRGSQEKENRSTRSFICNTGSATGVDSRLARTCSILTQPTTSRRWPARSRIRRALILGSRYVPAGLWRSRLQSGAPHKLGSFGGARQSFQSYYTPQERERRILPQPELTLGDWKGLGEGKNEARLLGGGHPNDVRGGLGTLGISAPKMDRARRRDGCERRGDADRVGVTAMAPVDRTSSQIREAEAAARGSRWQLMLTRWRGGHLVRDRSSYPPRAGHTPHDALGELIGRAPRRNAGRSRCRQRRPVSRCSPTMRTTTALAAFAQQCAERRRCPTASALFGS